MTGSTGRIALVTGAGQGIGRGVAEKLATLGHHVVLLDRDPDLVAKAAQELAGHDVSTAVADVSDWGSVADAVAQIDHAHGRLDILINNAGISPSHGGSFQLIEEVDLDEWARVIGVNLTGTFLMCRAALPIMKRNAWGRIVNFSSQGGRMRSQLSGAHYAATKAGVIGFTRILAGQGGPYGITANTLAPGRINTPQSRSFDVSEAYLAQLPVGRLGEPEDIAAGVAYLVSEEAGFVTGTVLDVNGGFYMP